jgi:hypothetical protein
VIAAFLAAPDEATLDAARAAWLRARDDYGLPEVGCASRASKEARTCSDADRCELVPSKADRYNSALTSTIPAAAIALGWPGSGPRVGIPLR